MWLPCQFCGRFYVGNTQSFRKRWEFPSESFGGPHGAWVTESFQDNDITLALYDCNLPVNIHYKPKCERKLEPHFKAACLACAEWQTFVSERKYSVEKLPQLLDMHVYSRSFVWPMREVVERESLPTTLKQLSNWRNWSFWEHFVN